MEVLIMKREISIIKNELGALLKARDENSIQINNLRRELRDALAQENVELSELDYAAKFQRQRDSIPSPFELR
jgi:hypothetical protein